MKPVLIFALVVALPFVAISQEAVAPTDAPAATAQAPAVEAPAGLQVLDAADVALADLKWHKRLVVVFSDTPEDPAFQLQMRFLMAEPKPLEERDVVVITDTDPAAHSELRQKLRPRGFSLVLIDKDNAVSLRKPLPWDVREISRAIDKMPMRREEIRNGGTTN